MSQNYMRRCNMDVLKHLADLVYLYKERRLMEAESLEYALLSELRKSSKPENVVAVAILEEHKDCAADKVINISRARRYLESAYSIRSIRSTLPSVEPVRKHG
jgi:hypothetical protein